MKLARNLSQVGFANAKFVRYIVVDKKTADQGRKEEQLVAELLQRLQDIKLPPHQLKQLGLDRDWQKKVSPAFVEQVVKTAERYKKVLKELSKY